MITSGTWRRRAAGLRRVGLTALVLGGLAGLWGCGVGGGSAGDSMPTARVVATEVVALAAGAEFVVGENRVPFALFTQENEFVPGATVRAQFSKLGEEYPEPRFSADAVYREVTEAERHVHEDGKEHLHGEARGIYVVDGVIFDEAGFWGIELAVTMPGTGAIEYPTMALQVRDDPMAIGVGEAAPRSQNLTAADVEDLGEITTMPEPEQEFYKETVAAALERGRPIVVAIASPAFCVSRMCGPVMEVVAEVHVEYGGRVGFIHVEPYDLEAARTTGQLELTETAAEWRLPTEPWVFVVGGDGRVKVRFEGLFGAEELEMALAGVVG